MARHKALDTMHWEISKEMVAWYQENFPKGTRIEMLRPVTEGNPPRGTLGTVDRVNNVGTIYVRWDNGYYSRIVYRQDACRRVE